MPFLSLMEITYASIERGAASGALIDASNLLKPQLSSGELAL